MLSSACMCVSALYGLPCIMRVNVYVGTRDAMQDARWCYVPTDHVAADRQQQMARLDRSIKATAEVQCWQLSQATRKRLETVRMLIEV